MIRLISRRKRLTSLEEAVRYHILDSQGILYDEPGRLFTDEMRTSVRAFSVISLIATGSNRLSEIAARLNKPATQLSRILTFLTDLGYIRREIPFGESEKSTKKSLYKINDPFLNFYFSFIVPNRSLIGAGLADLEIDLVARSADRSALLIAEAKWTRTINISQTENLLRQKIDHLPFIKDQKVIKALFLRSKPRKLRSEILLFDADDVCA